MALLPLIVPPSPLMLGLCFLAVFIAVFGVLRRAATAGERRATHEVARVRLGISDEYAMPEQWAKREWTQRTWTKPLERKIGQRG